MTGILLNILASIIKWLIQPGVYLITMLGLLLFNRKEIGTYNLKLAKSKDQLGNVLIQHIANWVLIKREGYSFGNEDETISSVIGKNKKKGTLSLMGKVIDKILDLIDNNHSINSIDKTI